MTSKHTPGPWLLRGESDTVHQVSETHPYGTCIFGFHDDCVPDDHDLALILAAPELYAAVAAVIDATRDYLPPGGITKEEFISRVIAATDNARMAEIMK